MKKKAIIVLAVLASCKNYDDRFDALNEQITALEPLEDISYYVTKSTGGVGASSYAKKDVDAIKNGAFLTKREAGEFLRHCYHDKYVYYQYVGEIPEKNLKHLKSRRSGYPYIPIPPDKIGSEEKFEEEFNALFSWHWNYREDFGIEEKFEFLLAEHLSLPKTFNYLKDERIIPENYYITDRPNYYIDKHGVKGLTHRRFRELVSYEGYISYAVEILSESSECSNFSNQVRDKKVPKYSRTCDIGRVWITARDREDKEIQFHKELNEDVIILPYLDGVHIEEKYNAKITCELSYIVKELEKVDSEEKWKNALTSPHLKDYKKTVYKDKGVSIFDSSFSFKPQVIVEDDFYYDLEIIFSLYAPGTNYFVFAWVDDAVYVDTTLGVDLSISETRRFRTWQHKRTPDDKLDFTRSITDPNMRSAHKVSNEVKFKLVKESLKARSENYTVGSDCP